MQHPQRCRRCRDVMRAGELCFVAPQGVFARDDGTRLSRRGSCLSDSPLTADRLKPTTVPMALKRHCGELSRDLSRHRSAVYVWLTPRVFAIRYDWDSLSADEARRARSFRSKALEDRFVQQQTLLRWIIGSCVGIEPRQVSFRTGEFGKPTIGQCNHALYFSVANTRKYICVAVGGSPIGMDFEETPTVPVDYDAFRSLMTNCEGSGLAGVDDSPGIVRRWVRKEAYVKATGRGWSVDPQSFCCGPPGSNPRPVRLSDGSRSGWDVVSAKTASGEFALAFPRGRVGYIRVVPIYAPAPSTWSTASCWSGARGFALGEPLQARGLLVSRRCGYGWMTVRGLEGVALRARIGENFNGGRSGDPRCHA